MIALRAFRLPAPVASAALRFSAPLLAGLVGLVAAPCAGADIGWMQAPMFYLPGTVVEGEATLAEGATVVELPLRWAWAVRMPHDLSIIDGDEPVPIAKGTLLPKVMVLPAEEGGKIRYAYCTRSRVVELLEGRGNLLVADDYLREAHADIQYCIGDGDGDGRFDHAFALGKGADLVELGSIDPFTATEMRDEPISEPGFHVRFALENLTDDSVRLGQSVTEAGIALEAYSGRDGIGGSFVDLPVADGKAASYDLGGIRFTVGPIDRETDTVTVRWTRIKPPEEAVLVPV